MFFNRGKCVLAAFLLIFLIQFSCGKTPTIPDDLFKFMKTLNSTNPTEQLLKYISPGTYTQGNNYKQFIRSRSSGNNGGPKIEYLDLDEQICTLVPQVHFMDQPPVSSGYLVWPLAIKIPRCLGSCGVHPDILQCVPVKQFTENVTMLKVYFGKDRKRREVINELSKDPVHYVLKRSAEDVIFNVSVSYPTDCARKCRETVLTCAAKGKKFNNEYCRCYCPNRQICTGSFKWDDDTCRCVCGKSNKAGKKLCDFKFGLKASWDKTICDCKCNPCRRKFQHHGDDGLCNCKCNTQKLKSSCARYNKKPDENRCRCKRKRRPRPRRPVGK